MLEILQDIFEVCIIPLIGVLTTYAITYINKQKAELIKKSENEILDKYLNLLGNTISDCVAATTQTYTEALKKEGKFDAEAQQKAFDMTFNTVKALLTEEAQKYISTAVGDIDQFIKSKIEAEINNKKGTN